MQDDLHIDDRTTIPGRELEVSVSRSSGSGGQNVNKVNSRVELRYNVNDSVALPTWVKRKLATLAGNRMTNDGHLRLIGQEHRSQQQNLKACLERLRELILKAKIIPKARRATKPTKGSKRRRMDNKRARGTIKSGRSWKPGKDD